MAAGGVEYGYRRPRAARAAVSAPCRMRVDGAQQVQQRREWYVSRVPAEHAQPRREERYTCAANASARPAALVPSRSLRRAAEDVR